ncbi:hypothetical protein [Clostridium beijerinckii]|nr:hypothetical protein [Clostridium beijerinckii]
MYEFLGEDTTLDKLDEFQKIRFNGCKTMFNIQKLQKEHIGK